MSNVPSADASLESRVLNLLASVAPDVDPASVRADLDFRDQFDFDSMALFNVAAAIHQSFGIDIPERDYRNLTSLAKCVAYLRGKLPQI
ncbi:MAG TPA: acyl carrier protein [Steroidobacteraceae bacterium]|jgi:acyl carrier protein|nr:acyl carrier protein [Steroidobacteraceae bacterium]